MKKIITSIILLVLIIGCSHPHPSISVVRFHGGKEWGVFLDKKTYNYYQECFDEHKKQCKQKHKKLGGKKIYRLDTEGWWVDRKTFNSLFEYRYDHEKKCPSRLWTNEK